MRGGNLQSGSGQLQEAFEKLQEAWAATREHWSDQNAVAFEETYLKTIAEEVSHSLPAIGQMSQTLGNAVRECEE